MKIKTSRMWNSMDVRQMCIDHRLYTRGDSKAYAKMLEKVTELDPTPRSLYRIAEDILNHSDPEIAGDDVTAIMFLLEREVVATFYDIEKKEA